MAKINGIAKTVWKGLVRLLELIAKGITGRSIKIVTIEDENGELAYTADGDRIYIAPRHYYMEGMCDYEAVMFVKGLFAHELMHQLATDFAEMKRVAQTLPVHEQQIFVTIFNVMEDPAIEYQVRIYIGGHLVRALSFMTMICYRKAQELSPGSPYSQFINALIHYGNGGLVKGEFYSDEAKEYFRKVLPIFDKAIEEPNPAKRVAYAKEVFDITRPLWQAEAIEELLKSLASAMAASGKSTNSSSSTPIAPPPSSSGEGSEGEGAEEESSDSSEKSFDSSSSSRKEMRRKYTRRLLQEEAEGEEDEDGEDSSDLPPTDSSETSSNESGKENAEDKSGRGSSLESDDEESSDEGGVSDSENDISDDFDADSEDDSDYDEDDEDGEGSASDTDGEDDTDYDEDDEDGEGSASDADGEDDTDYDEDDEDGEGSASDTDGEDDTDYDEDDEDDEDSASGSDSDTSDDFDSENEDDGDSDDDGVGGPKGASSSESDHDSSESSKSDPSKSDSSDSVSSGGASSSPSFSSEVKDEDECGYIDREEYEISEEDIAEVKDEMAQCRMQEETERRAASEASEKAPEYDDLKSAYPKVKCLNKMVHVTATATISTLYAQISSRLNGDVNMLVNHLKRIMRNEPDENEYRSNGRINVKRLNRGTMTANVFTRHREPSDRSDVAVLFLLDESGSMGWGGKAECARECAIGLAEVFARLKIPTKIIGFTADEGKYDVIHYHYLNWINTPSERLKLLNIAARSDNFDGYSIRYAARMLAERKEEHKLLVVISDGQPACYYYPSDKAGVTDAKNAVNEALKDVDVLGVAIGNSDTDTLYAIYRQHFLHCSNASEMLHSIGSKLKAIIKKW